MPKPDLRAWRGPDWPRNCQSISTTWPRCEAPTGEPEGQAIVLRLIETADVPIENFKVGNYDFYGAGGGIERIGPFVARDVSGVRNIGETHPRHAGERLPHGLGSSSSVSTSR